MGLLILLRLQWDRAIAVVAAGVGLLALLLGYFGTSGTPHVAQQLPFFISGGLFGIFCLTVSAIAWISADLRDEWRELHGIRELLDEELRQRGLRATPFAQGVATEAPVAQPSPTESLNGVTARSQAPRRRARKVTSAAAVEK
jgi:hypothetical protein